MWFDSDIGERNISGHPVFDDKIGEYVPSEDPDSLLPCDYCNDNPMPKKRCVNYYDELYEENLSNGEGSCMTATEKHDLAKSIYRGPNFEKKLDKAIKDALQRGLSGKAIKYYFDKIGREYVDILPMLDPDYVKPVKEKSDLEMLIEAEKGQIEEAELLFRETDAMLIAYGRARVTGVDKDKHNIIGFVDNLRNAFLTNGPDDRMDINE